jgi:beta-lactamase regulating signal transducer with metallopeptidase domain
MNVFEFAQSWLARGAVGGLIVLAAGSLAARFCRQPVRRARIVNLTLLAAFAVPWLGALPVVPRWSAGFALAKVSYPAADSGEIRAARSPGAPLGSIELTKPPVVFEIGEARLHSRVERTGQNVGDGGRKRRSWTSRLATAPWNIIVLTAYGALSAGMAAWWLFGQMLLWRVTRAARPARPEICDAFCEISGPPGRDVFLLESDMVELPFTFTWARPVVVLPRSLCDAGGSQELRFCLAHEWCHIERHDSRAWNFAGVAGFVLFYQPLFWWLRRQMRLCQDYLADDRAAAVESAEDYAAYLVRLAQARVRPTASPLPALGVSDRPSNLYRRVAMLVQEHEPLQHHCRAVWSLAIVASAAVVMVVASGLRLDAAAPRDGTPAVKQATAPPATAKVEGARTWKGRITEKGTGKAIAHADVVVKISVNRDKTTNQRRTIREVHRTTAPDGAFDFTISPEEAAERLLYITLRVEAHDYVGYLGGDDYGMILKDEKLGERPFYENLELWPGSAIEGLVQTPDGKPEAGVKVEAFSSPDPGRIFEKGTWTEGETDVHGHFRLVLYQKGTAVFWILPQEYVPATHGLKNNRRGDLGTFVLEKGIEFGGRVLDSSGKPVGGVCVEVDLDKTERNEDDAVPRGVGDRKQRAALTAADGSFAFRPLPPGKYRVYPSEQGWEPSTRDGAHDPPQRPLPFVFSAQTVTLKEGKTSDPIEIRAVPHVVVEAQHYNSKGEKCGGYEVFLVGEVNGGLWQADVQPTADGAYTILAPKGLLDARIMLITDDHSALRFRTSKDEPLERGAEIRLGTLDDDVKGIEIVRWDYAILLVKAQTKDNKPVPGLEVSAHYSKEVSGQAEGEMLLPVGGRWDVSFTKQADGRFRSEQLQSDIEFEVSAESDGFKRASRTLKLAEGKIEEITLVLEPE